MPANIETLSIRADPMAREQHAAVTGALAEGMSLAELQEYLSVHGFLHVTPRFNIEPVKRMDWYDLVILEVPGNCKTGMVYERNSAEAPRRFLWRDTKWYSCP